MLAVAARFVEIIDIACATIQQAADSLTSSQLADTPQHPSARLSRNSPTRSPAVTKFDAGPFFADPTPQRICGESRGPAHGWHTPCFPSRTGGPAHGGADIGIDGRIEQGLEKKGVSKMSVLLAIATFALFIALDYLVNARRAETEQAAPQESLAPGPTADRAPAPTYIAPPVWVAGYQLPEDFRYHSGHTWARQVGPEEVVIGLDDFARQLIGPAEGIDLPPVGSRVRQGAPGFSVRLDGRKADLVAPVDGEVIETNSTLARSPRLATEDPYGRGWIMKLRSADLGRNLRNLLSGSVARKWTEDSRERIELQLMALSGSVLTDGGRPVADFAAHLEDEDWRRLVGEFLLT